MNVKLWNIKKGLLFGLGLFFLGMVLQFFFGQVKWNYFESPFNLLALLIFLVLLLLLNIYKDKISFFRWLSDTNCATSSMLWCSFVTALMGLIRQTGADSSWHGFESMTSQWSFILMYLWLTTSVVMVLFRLAFPISLKKIPFYLSHLGIAVVILSATLGKADLKTDFLLLEKGQNKQTAHLQMELLSSSMERYDDGMPKSYNAEILFCNGEWQEKALIEVNSPFSHKDLKVYLNSFDEEGGQYVVLRIVRDPWLYAVYFGIFMTLAGAIIRFLGLWT